MNKIRDTKEWLINNIVLADCAKDRAKDLRSHSISGIYTIECVSTKHIYVGSSNDVIYRFVTHILAMQNQKHNKQKMNDHFKKYGEASFRYKLEHVIHDSSAMFRLELITLHAIQDADIPTYNMKRDKKHR